MGHAVKPLPPTAAEVRYLHVGPGGGRIWREPRCAEFHLGGGSPTWGGGGVPVRSDREGKETQQGQTGSEHPISSRGAGEEPDSPGPDQQFCRPSVQVFKDRD